MPKLPSKFSEISEEKLVMPGHEGSRVTADEMMDGLKVYINKLIRFSPLIRSLFYLR